MSIEQAGRIADELAAALSSMAASLRTRCDHTALTPADCALCAQRTTAIAALDTIAAAVDQVEVAIETVLTAMDDLRRTVDDTPHDFGDAARRAELAEARYRLWLHDNLPADAL